MARDLEFLESTYTAPEAPEEAVLRAWQQYRAQLQLQLQSVSSSPPARSVAAHGQRHASAKKLH